MATLSVNITESIIINGKDQGGTYSGFTNSSITQVEKRQINITTTEVSLYGTSGSQANATGGPLWDRDKVKYVRITNLDTTTTNFILIVVKNADNDEFLIKLYGTESFLLHRHVNSMHAKEGAAAVGDVGDITLVTAQADTSTQAVEFFIASEAL